MTRGWRIYFGSVALTALALIALGLVVNARREREASSPLNLAQPIHAKLVVQPEPPRLAEVRADPSDEPLTSPHAIAAYRALLNQSAHDEYLRAFALGDEDPKQALEMFRHVEQLTSLDDELHEKAKAHELQQLKLLEPEAKRLFPEAYVRRDVDPEAAIAQFKEVLAITAPDDEYHLAAQAQLDRLANP